MIFFGQRTYIFFDHSLKGFRPSILAQHLFILQDFPVYLLYKVICIRSNMVRYIHIQKLIRIRSGFFFRVHLSNARPFRFFNAYNVEKNACNS